MSLEDFIHAANVASTPKDLTLLLTQKLETYGFDRLVYSYMTACPALQKCAEHGVIHNYPLDWMQHYATNGYTELDPVYLTAKNSCRPFTWRSITQSNPLSRSQKRVMNEANEAGLKDGVALSIRGPLGEIVGVGLASSVGGVNASPDILSELYLLIHQFHYCNTNLALHPLSHADEHPLPILSRREREILTWCAKSKSNSIIAELLGISAKTVDFHLANIFKKLGVNSRILAVLKAIQMDIISL